MKTVAAAVFVAVLASVAVAESIPPKAEPMIAGPQGDPPTIQACLERCGPHLWRWCGDELRDAGFDDDERCVLLGFCDRRPRTRHAFRRFSRCVREIVDECILEGLRGLPSFIPDAQPVCP